MLNFFIYENLSNIVAFPALSKRKQRYSFIFFLRLNINYYTILKPKLVFRRLLRYFKLFIPIQMALFSPVLSACIFPATIISYASCYMSLSDFRFWGEIVYSPFYRIKRTGFMITFCFRCLLFHLFSLHIYGKMPKRDDRLCPSDISTNYLICLTHIQTSYSQNTASLSACGV